jgi:hypothetical protein
MVTLLLIFDVEQPRRHGPASPRSFYRRRGGARGRGDLPVPVPGPLVVRTKCGIVGANTRPNWVYVAPARTSIYCSALIGDKGIDAGWLRERLRAPSFRSARGRADMPSMTEKNTSGGISSKTSLRNKSLSTHCHALRQNRRMLAAIINLVATVLWKDECKQALAACRT